MKEYIKVCETEKNVNFQLIKYKNYFTESSLKDSVSNNLILRKIL